MLVFSVQSLLNFLIQNINMQMKSSSISHCYTLPTVHISTIVQENSSLNYHLRLHGAILRLFDTWHFKLEKMNLSHIDSTAVGKWF